MAWNDVSSIPWLNTNPQEFSLRSAQAAEGIGRNFAQGMRTGMEGAQQRALLPLQQKLLEDRQKLSALELQTEISKREDSISAKAAFAKMATAAADISNRSAWADPKSEAQIWAIAKDHPAVVNTPEFRNIIGQFDIAGKAVVAIKDAETRALAAADRAAAAAERNLLLKDQIAFKDLQHAEDVTSREKIATEGNLSREAIAKDRDDARIEAAWAKASLTAKDKLSEMGYRAFSEELDNITRDTEMSTDQKRTAIRMLHQRAENGLYLPTAPTDFPTPTAKEPEFAGELEAKAAGKKAGDIVIIMLNGRRTRVRLK